MSEHNGLTQRACAKRALRKLFVARLARRLLASGVGFVLSREIVQFRKFLTKFPTVHSLDTVSSSLQPLRLSGVAAGGAGGGGPGQSQSYLLH